MQGNCNSGCYGSYCYSAPRGFLTKKEKIEMLKEYKEALEKESQGIAERLEELESEK